VGDIWGWDLDLRPFGDKVRERLRLDSRMGNIPDVVAHEFKCLLGDPSRGITVADVVSERV
jgi:hypothetical protein